MLTVDPRKRATVRDILNNPWFRIDLPANLFAPVTQKITDSAVNIRAIKEASEVSYEIFGKKFMSEKIYPIFSVVVKKCSIFTLNLQILGKFWSNSEY